MKRALIRFGRTIVAAALAAGITAAITSVKSLPINDPTVIAVLTAALVALDKWLRDNGIY